MAEKHLDDFWTSFEDALVTKVGKASAQLMSDRIEQQQILRTPPWVEPSLENRDSDNWTIKDLTLQSAFSNDRESTPKKGKIWAESQPHVKVKTRGEPSVQDRTPDATESREDGISSSDGEPVQERIPVGNKHFRTFLSLFRNPTTEDSAGELPWKNFVHAMTHVGFTA